MDAPSGHHRSDFASDKRAYEFQNWCEIGAIHMRNVQAGMGGKWRVCMPKGPRVSLMRMAEWKVFPRKGLLNDYGVRSDSEQYQSMNCMGSRPMGVSHGGTGSVERSVELPRAARSRIGSVDDDLAL